jgi:ComF family protein
MRHPEPADSLNTVSPKVTRGRLRWPTVPSQCAVCATWPSEPVCAACVSRFAGWPARRCQTCAIGLPTGLADGPAALGQCGACLRQAPPLDRACAAVAYRYPWSSLIAQFKFGEQPGWAHFFAGLLLRQPDAADALAALGPEDWLVPLPLSAERLAQRGFNQAWELTQALRAQSMASGRADARLLLRIANTRAQSQLPRDQRLANVAQAFAVDPLRTATLAGRRVVLVDDVMTSGASVFSAARALREAGAAHVTALVFARTEEPD